ncbi:MAG: hypothetical protein R3324_19360 [Halobacteriales archaeon]|nr:hypothetical protein [Halobacteriales archaeon]
MAWQPVELSCPSCEATVRADLDAVLPDGGDDRLRGRDLACRACGHEFEVFVL